MKKNSQARLILIDEKTFFPECFQCSSICSLFSNALSLIDDNDNNQTEPGCWSDECRTNKLVWLQIDNMLACLPAINTGHVSREEQAESAKINIIST